NAAGASPPFSFPYTFLPAPAFIMSVNVNPSSNSQHQAFHAVVVVVGGAVHLTCVIDGQPAVPCGPDDLIADPGPGAHTIEVTARNARGSFTALPPFPFTYVL